MFDSFDILMYSILFFFGFCFLGMVAGAINQSAQRILGTLALLGWFLDHLFTVVEGAISIGGEAIKRIMAGVWFILKLTWIHLLWPALKLMGGATLSAADSIYSAAEEWASCWNEWMFAFSLFVVLTSLSFPLSEAAHICWWFKLLSGLIFVAAATFFLLVIGFVIKNQINQISRWLKK